MKSTERKNSVYEKAYSEKKKLKRIQSKAFPKQCKNQNRLKQAKWRLNKKQQQTIAPSSSLTSTTATTKSICRKREGEKRRRADTMKMKNEIEQLRNTVRVLTTENKKLKATRSATPPRQSATSLFLDNISPSAKRRATNRLKDRKNDLPRGSQHELRKELGINLSNSNIPKKTTPSPLHNRIEQFLNRDDISKLCPDKKKHVNNQQIRYRLNHLTVLHQQFEIETGIGIDYDTFCRHVPDNIQKPNHDNWGTYLCITCLNPQMKFEKLQHLKSKLPLVKTVLDRYSCDLSEVVKDDDQTEGLKIELMKLNTEKFNVTYSEWQKKKVPNCTAPVSTKITVTHTIQEFLKKFIPEIDTLTSHVHRIREQFHAAKMSKEEAKAEDDIATIQLDWSENYHLQQAREEKGAFYFEQHVALHTGYVWLKDGSFSFGCLSDDTNHMAEAAWAGIQPILNHLVDEKEVSTINVISDSPISQYRNKTMFYLMKRFAIEQKIKFKWIYLEAGHGKGVADAIGATLKRKMDEAVNYKPDDSFSSASDLIDAIEDTTDIKLYLYGKSDVEEVKRSLPKLSAIKGTATLHEVVATSDGKLYGKDLSSDKERLLKMRF